VDFQLTCDQQRLQNKSRELAADFLTRSAAHDRDASHPVENYDRLRNEGFLALTIGKEWGGLGTSFLDHTIAYEALGQGCPSTALAFNMHASVVMPLLESAEVSAETKRVIADLVVRERKLIAGNFSEPVTTSLIGERPLKARARRADGGYRVTGRKMFASMPNGTSRLIWRANGRCAAITVRLAITRRRSQRQSPSRSSSSQRASELDQHLSRHGVKARLVVNDDDRDVPAMPGESARHPRS
jgi:alkylation response protein AidB-like acyl-CoA dehydrogenase